MLIQLLSQGKVGGMPGGHTDCAARGPTLAAVGHALLCAGPSAADAGPRTFSILFALFSDLIVLEQLTGYLTPCVYSQW